jgi:hypothetical protein
MLKSTRIASKGQPIAAIGWVAQLLRLDSLLRARDFC